MPSSSLTSLFAAIDTVGKPVNWPSIDVIADRNSLRKLLWWVDGSHSDDDFRIDLELVGKKTLLMNRWEKRYQDPENGRSYSLAFDKACTDAVEGCVGNIAHHRIMQYVSTGFIVEMPKPKATPT